MCTSMSACGNTFDLKTHPVWRDVKDFLQYYPMTRDELVSFIEEPRTTIYEALECLLFVGWVIKEPAKRTTRGRPVIFFKFIEEYL